MAKKRPLKKRILNSPAAHWVLSLLASLLVRAIYATCRVSREFEAGSLPYMCGEKPAIFCFWHGRLIMQPFLRPRARPLYVLISHHNDGALITATIRWFGIDSVRGSRKQGAAQAVFDLLRVTEAQANIAITPDGPRGPFQKAAPGAAYVAAKTGYPLVPVAFSASRHWRFGSWDKFMLPKPFARIRFLCGAPMFVTEEEAAATAQLETDLTRITAEADEACGVTP